MDDSGDHPQFNHPQNVHARSKPSTNVFGPDGCDNREEGLDTATVNTGTHGSHALAQVRDAFHGQLPRTVVPVESVSTPYIMENNTILQNAQGVNISGNTNFHNIGSINVYGEGNDGLENLNGFISFDAQFDSSVQDPDRRCHPGTREKVLERLREWIDKPKAKERVFWLYGPAGAGKSAIAQTIARSSPRPKVAASFFFFRSDVNRNDGNRLFTTLAHQLVFSIPEIRGHIAHSLSERPHLPRTDIETQFDQLLARPFQEVITQQLVPAVHNPNDIVKEYQELAPIIIIDGVDECTDENLQRRFLKVIGNAVKDDLFPLRFLIVSRPELHIEQTFRCFQTPLLRIDLAKLDDANRDIEKYLVDEFSRIASEQGLHLAWPGKKIIDDIVYKSSGNFIFAALVIRFVGDQYCFARTQLDIVLNIKPPKTMTPFAILDRLFLEILRRVPEQEFLKRYLVLLVARISAPSHFGELYRDDAVLMHVSEQELHANLRRMRSLLKFEPRIDVHHRSFLDFLHDSSRSDQYYIRKQAGTRGYLEVFIHSLVSYVSTAIEQLNQHNATHFAPGFREMVKWYPPKIELSSKEWQEVIQPLLDLQDKLLQLPNFTSTWDFLHCDKCTVFHLLRELVHLGLHLGFQSTTASVSSVADLQRRRGVIASMTSTTGINNDLDNILLSLFRRIPQTTKDYSPHKGIINLMSAILRFDYAETVTRVRSVSDAQKLVDLLDYVIHAKNMLHPDATRNASLLALEIYARAPIVPLSYFLGADDKPYYYTWRRATHIEIMSQTIFVNRILDHRYIVPVLGVKKSTGPFKSLRGAARWNNLEKIQIMFRLANAIQYLHSMGVVLDHQFCSSDVFLDSGRPKILCLFSTSRSLLDKECKEYFTAPGNIFSFGCLFYELYSDVVNVIRPDDSISDKRRVITKRPSGQHIPKYVWKLIQRCCAKRPERRPTISEVVKEMKGWHSLGDVELDDDVNETEGGNIVRPVETLRQSRACFGALCFVLLDLVRNWC